MAAVHLAVAAAAKRRRRRVLQSCRSRCRRWSRTRSATRRNTLPPSSRVHSATIMSDVEGWIFDIHVHSGEFVKKGQTLMEIDPRRQQAAVSNFDSQRASKEATLQWAKVQLDRAKALSESGVVSQQDLEQAQSTYDSAAGRREVDGRADHATAGAAEVLQRLRCHRRASSATFPCTSAIALPTPRR